MTGKMTILDEMEAALKPFAAVFDEFRIRGMDMDEVYLWVGDSTSGQKIKVSFGDCFRARETLREYESLKGQIAVVPVQTSEARKKALNALDDLIKAGDKAFEGEVAVDGWNTDNLIVEARHQKSRFLQFASFNFPGAQPDPRANAHFVSVCFNRRDLFKQIRAALQQPDTSEAVRVLVEAIKEAAKGCSAISLIAPEIKDCREYAEMMKVELDRILSNPAVIAAMKGEDHGS